jgi:hypothetical protein
VSESVRERAADTVCSLAWSARCIVIGLSPFAGIAFVLGLTPLSWRASILAAVYLLFAVAAVGALASTADAWERYVRAFRRARRIARIRRKRGIKYGT